MRDAMQVFMFLAGNGVTSLIFHLIKLCWHRLHIEIAPLTLNLPTTTIVAPPLNVIK
jgi:hypothetical protein